MTQMKPPPENPGRFRASCGATLDREKGICMKRDFIVFSIGVTIASATAGARNTTQHHVASQYHVEKIEWTRSEEPALVDSNLPNALLVGDSITQNYYPNVVKTLAGRANVFLFVTSASAGDWRLNRQVADYGKMINTKFAVIHFNNGMHGWGYAESAYGSHLPGLIATLHSISPGAKLVWASTTPVRAAKPGGPTNERIDARNALAAHIMRAEAVSIDDQHRLMQGKEPLYIDDVHFGDKGAAIQGAAAASAIADKLPT